MTAESDARFADKPSAFGYIPKSEQVSHLTVTKQLVEKCDLPDIKLLKNGDKLPSSIGGSVLMCPLSTGVAAQTTVTLPKATPGLSFRCIPGTAPASASADTLGQEAKFKLECASGDKLTGTLMLPEDGTQGGECVTVSDKTSIELTCASGASILSCMPSEAEFLCVQEGVFRVKAWGVWAQA